MDNQSQTSTPNQIDTSNNIQPEIQNSPSPNTKKQKKNLLIFITTMAIFIIVLLIAVLMLKNTEVDRLQLVINYLNSKYGDGDWKIVSEEAVTSTTLSGFTKNTSDDGYEYVVTSRYTGSKPFQIHLGRSDMVEDDYFLPTYYSLEYGLEYDELIDRMVYVTEYHYPYKDWYYSTSHSCNYEKPRCRIGSFEMGGVFEPTSVTYSPEASKDPDIIPDAGRVISLREIIEIAEQYYSSDRLKNNNTNDDEFYELVFKDKAGEDEIIGYIKEHTTPIEGIETTYSLSEK